MSIKSFAVVVVALALAAPAAAQQRGTMELGGFASGARFDQDLSLNLGVGVGGRIGMFFDRRWVFEFEKGEMRANRPNGLKNVNVGILSSRLVASDFRRGSVTYIVGAGAGISTETNFLHSYGVDLLGGVKIALNSKYNLRIDGVVDFLANEDWKSYQTIRVGLSWYRPPNM